MLKASPPAAAAADGPTRWDPPEADTSGDARKLRNLLRFIAVAIAIPALTISFAFFAFSGDPVGHVIHSVGFGLLGIAAIVLFVRAEPLSKRWE